MDDQRFDALTRSLPAIRGRRDLLRLLAGGAVSGVATLLGRPGHDAAAHDATRECGKIEDRQRRQQCLKRAKQHNWKHTLVCTGGSPDARPPCGDNPACSCYAAFACNGGFCAVAGGCDGKTPCPNGQADCPDGTVCVKSRCTDANGARIDICKALSDECPGPGTGPDLPEVPGGKTD